MRQILAAAVLVTSASLVSAGPLLVPLNQERTLEVSASVLTKIRHDTITTKGFDTSGDNVHVHPIMIAEDGTRYAAQGNIWNESQLGDDNFKLAGPLYAQSIHPAESTAGAAVKTCVTFNVTSPIHYALSGALTNPGNGPADGTIALMNASGETIAQSSTDSSINTNGILKPGTYQLQLDANGQGNSSLAGGGIDYKLNLAAAAVPLPPGVIGGGIILAPMILGRIRARCGRAC